MQLLKSKITYDLFHTLTHSPPLPFTVRTLIVKLPLKVKALLNISKPLKNNLNILLTFTRSQFLMISQRKLCVNPNPTFKQ